MPVRISDEQTDSFLQGVAKKYAIKTSKTSCPTSVTFGTAK